MAPPGHGEIIFADRRSTPRTGEAAPKPFWIGVLGAVIAGISLWAFTTAAGGGIVTGSRFATDSARHDRENARRDSTLSRIDSRVGAMYCASLPKDKQPGCR